jgi:hypothetical protein
MIEALPRMGKGCQSAALSLRQETQGNPTWNLIASRAIRPLALSWSNAEAKPILQGKDYFRGSFRRRFEKFGD